MKKTHLILLVLMTFSSVNCIDQKIPKQTEIAFLKKYPWVMNEKWSRDSHGNFEASFKIDGIKHRADFDFNDGSWIETEVSIEYIDLPDAIKKVLSQKYSNERISEIEKVDHHLKGLFYDVEFKSKGNNIDLEFNQAGEIIGFEN